MNNFIKATTFFLFLIQTTHAIIFNIQNNCRYTVWPAAVPGGGRRLDPGQSWTIGFPNGPNLAKIWARTNCTFDSSGRGSCLTGDCNGRLECGSYGAPPHTVAEYGLNSFGHKDYYDISVMEGFNVPMEFTPTTNGCTRPVRCAADITGECPSELRVAGGCHNPCTVHKTTQYCCHSGRCRPTELSRFFKRRCRDAFTYPEDDPTSTFTCPPGTSYRVVFCP
ncbi:thaumatin-like protein [Phtheirospermum japonicum]|uniref:Thaumatin-like protein n=1 Tax=Phtheirospermum japonicum TaxID=374723 RepID=A0A830CYU3_9LAMI|nr:thaumatin-like protein [Phtheirospermum japonicum]